MIQKGTLLKVIDNSSVYTVKCIGIFEGYKKRYAKISQLILVSVQKIRSKSKTSSKIKKGEIFKAVVVRLKKKTQRSSGFFLNFSSSAAVLLNSQEKPIGTKIRGMISKELRSTKFLRIAALANGLL